MKCPTMSAGLYSILVVVITFVVIVLFDFTWDFIRDKKWRNLSMFKKKEQKEKHCCKDWKERNRKKVNIADVLKEVIIVSGRRCGECEDVVFFAYNYPKYCLTCVCDSRIVDFYESDTLNELVTKLKNISDKIEFIVDDNMKDILVTDVIEYGPYWMKKYWKERENEEKVMHNKDDYDILDVIKELDSNIVINRFPCKLRKDCDLYDGGTFIVVSDTFEGDEHIDPYFYFNFKIYCCKCTIKEFVEKLNDVCKKYENNVRFYCDDEKLLNKTILEVFDKIYFEKQSKEKNKMKIVNIVDVLKEIDNETDNSDRVLVSEYKISDVSFFINKFDIRHLYVSTTNKNPMCIDINKNIKYLVDRLRGISKYVMFVVDDNMKDMRIGDVLKNGKYWIGKNKMKTVNIVDVIRDLLTKDSIKYGDMLFVKHSEPLSYIECSIDYKTETFKYFYYCCLNVIVSDLNIRSNQVMFIVDDKIKNMTINEYLEKELNTVDKCVSKYMKTIDKCENKNMICKSRAECMKEITEQNKFDVEEEFKKICIKERESVLERIHEEIEEKAKLGNNKTEIYLNVNYLGCDFSYLYYSSSMFYNDGTILRDDYNSFYGRRFFLSEFVNANSYVWKFVDKLDYQTAKRISLLYVRDWIKQTLVEDEGFDVEVSEYGVFTISW